MSQRKSSAQMADARAFGRRLRESRGSLTQAELGERAGMTRSAIANYELGRSIPSNATVEALAKALGVDPSALKAEPTVEDWEAQLSAGSTLDQLSADELALARLIRCAPEEYTIDFIDKLISYFEGVDKAFRFVDPDQASKDLARLYSIRRRKAFQFGTTAESVTKVARFLAGIDDF